MQEIYAKFNPQTTSYPLYEVCHGIRVWMPFCDAECSKVRQNTNYFEQSSRQTCGKGICPLEYVAGIQNRKQRDGPFPRRS